MNPWQSLEAIPGLVAVAAIWQRRMGEHFPALRATCLEPDDWQVESYPCPRECGCWHKVILRHDFLARTGAAALTHQLQQSSSSSFSFSSSIPSDSTNPSPEAPAAIGVCCCDPPACPDLPLTIADITPLKLNWTRLARELCRALSLNSKFSILPPPHTVQIGAWSAGAIPAILTIQVWRSAFRNAIAETVARLNSPFILLAPTTDQFDAYSQELLARVSAAFFPLDSTVTIAPSGLLLPARPPGELFARFTPHGKDPVPEDTARQLFALAKTLDTGNPKHKAQPSAVLRLYCVDGLEPNQIARELSCARSLVYARLSLLAQKLGRPPAELRQYSSHFQSIEASLSDSRAKRIQRKSAIDGDGNEDSNEH